MNFSERFISVLSIKFSGLIRYYVQVVPLGVGKRYTWVNRLKYFDLF